MKDAAPNVKGITSRTKSMDTYSVMIVESVGFLGMSLVIAVKIVWIIQSIAVTVVKTVTWLGWKMVDYE